MSLAIKPYNPDIPFENFSSHTFLKTLIPSSPGKDQYKPLPERISAKVEAHEAPELRELAERVSKCFQYISYSGSQIRAV
jgi:hypothetical protein